MAARIEPPYITAWSSEREFIIRPDLHVHGAPALFCKYGSRGEGQPVWGQIAEERQRECVARRRCQVCADLVAASGYLVVIPCEPLTRPSPLPLRLREPLVCRKCLPVTFRCPRIRQAFTDGKLYLIAVERFEWDPTLVVRTHPEHPHPKERAINAALDAAGCYAAVCEIEMRVTTGHVMPPWVLAKLAGAAT